MQSTLPIPYRQLHSVENRNENPDGVLSVSFLRFCAEPSSSMTRLFTPKAPRPPDHEHPSGNHRSTEMSLKEAKGRNPPSPAASQPVLRSHSFGGMSGGCQTTSSTQVLGQSMKRGTRPPAHARHHHHHTSGSKAATGFHALRKSPKVPKKPRPNRALLMFDSIKNGIR